MRSRRKHEEGAYLQLRDFRICGDVTVVLLGELGFSLAEVFASGVESGIGHACRIEIIVCVFDWRTGEDVKCVMT